MAYRTTKRDRSHLAIADTLRRYGYSVGDLAMVGSGFPDILVADANHTVLIEIKEPNGKIYISQLEFISRWKGFVGFAQSSDDAMRLMKEPSVHCLTAKEKDRIAGIALRFRATTKAKNPEIAVTAFEKRMKAAE